MHGFAASVLVLVALASQANAQPANSPLGAGDRGGNQKEKPAGPGAKAFPGEVGTGSPQEMR